jgi:Cysteine-rich secretory protein family
MGVEDRDWYREAPKRRRPVMPWILGAAMLAVALFAASPRGHRMLHLPGTRISGERSTHRDLAVSPLPGAPGITLHQAPLYPEGDRWRRFLADERTCPGGERTDLPPQQQVEVMLCLIDWARGRQGLSAPMQTALLTSTALQKAQEIVRCNNFAHAACGGDPAADVRHTTYHGAWGENLYIADGRYGAPRVALDGWLNSAGHRENLFRPEWRTQGIALVKLDRFGPYRGASLWVSHFGSE